MLSDNLQMLQQQRDRAETSFEGFVPLRATRSKETLLNPASATSTSSATRARISRLEALQGEHG